MKVMLINPLRQRILSWREQEILYMPLGLGYIAAFLRENGHSVKIIERRFFYKADYWDDKVMESVNYLTRLAIKDFMPDLVGVTASTPLIMDALRTIKIAKEVNPNIITIVGGCHPTAYPEFTLKQSPELDIVCRGEGEITTLEIANGVSWDEIDGITYRRDGRIVSNPKRKFISELDSLPYPARDLFDTRFYFSNNRSVMRGVFMKSVTLYTARGCPFECTFCQSPQLSKAGEGKYFRIHSPEYIIREIEHLVETYGIEGVFFLDDMFSINKARALSISRKLIQSGLNRRIKYIVQTRVDAVDDELMQALRDSGCFQLIFGCETGSNETLKRMNKKSNVDKNLDAIRLSQKYRINCTVNIMVGTPGETEGDIIETIKFLKKAHPSRIEIAKFIPLPGSLDYDRLTEQKILKGEYENWDEICERYVESDFTFANMSQKRFKELLNKLKRDIYLYTNYFFEFKNNLRVDSYESLKKLIFLILHIGFLYLPLYLQERFKKIIGQMNYTLRYIFYENAIKE